jgi:hypothetical protein
MDGSAAVSSSGNSDMALRISPGWLVGGWVTLEQTHMTVQPWAVKAPH